jgi:hypothetical protein
MRCLIVYPNNSFEITSAEETLGPASIEIVNGYRLQVGGVVRVSYGMERIGLRGCLALFCRSDRSSTPYDADDVNVLGTHLVHLVGHEEASENMLSPDEYYRGIIYIMRREMDITGMKHTGGFIDLTDLDVESLRKVCGNMAYLLDVNESRGVLSRALDPVGESLENCMDYWKGLLNHLSVR